VILDNVQTIFQDSLQALVGVSKGVALAAVAITPWWSFASSSFPPGLWLTA
jgi:hypothetical protein